MAANARRWSNVNIAIDSARATAITITAISKAATGVVSYTGTDPSNGDWVLISATGMNKVDGRLFRVANVNSVADTFELEGEDTTNYETFVSGTAQVITFGTALATATGLEASGGEPNNEEIYLVNENVARLIPGPATAISYRFTNVWDPDDTGLQALKAASDNATQKAVRITFADGAAVAFLGYVSCTLLPTGSAPGLVTTPAEIQMYGRPTVYGT